MGDPLYNFLVILPIFVVALLFIVVPLMQWVTDRFFDYRFELRFGGANEEKRRDHRRNVVLALVSLLIALAISFLLLEALIGRGLLHPTG